MIISKEEVMKSPKTRSARRSQQPHKSSGRPDPLSNVRPIGTKGQLIAGLARHQSLSSESCIGERIAAGLCAQSAIELKRTCEALSEEQGISMVEMLDAARTSLKSRLELVDAAFARVALPVDAGDIATSTRSGRDAG